MDARPPPPRPAVRFGRMRAAGRVAAFLALGGVGACAAWAVRMPLPFLLGPLLVTAAAVFLGARPATIAYGRELGQVAVGLAIGLRFVPEVVARTLADLPAMVIATVLCIVATSIAAAMLAHLGRLDRRTAFFATAAAGLAEMAVIARERGAAPEPVILVHTIRVMTIVTAVPLVVSVLGHDGGIAAPRTAPLDLEGAGVLLLLAAAAVGLARLLIRIRLPNAWLLVAAAVGAVAAATEHAPAAMPRGVLVAAQLVIGVWLGARIRRDLVLGLPRVSLAALTTTSFLVLAAVAGAVALSAATGLDFATSVLAVAPAGITEMVLTATALHLDVTAVTAFQLMRIAIVTTTIVAALTLFERLTPWLAKPLKEDDP